MCYGVFMCAVYSRKISPDFTDDFRWIYDSRYSTQINAFEENSNDCFWRAKRWRKQSFDDDVEWNETSSSNYESMVPESKIHDETMISGFNSDQELLCNRNWMFPKSECDEGNIQFPVVGEQRESPTDQFGPFIFFDFCLVSVQLPRCRCATPDATRITRSLFARSFYA